MEKAFKEISAEELMQYLRGKEERVYNDYYQREMICFKEHVRDDGKIIPEGCSATYDLGRINVIDLFEIDDEILYVYSLPKIYDLNPEEELTKASEFLAEKINKWLHRTWR